MHGMKNVQYFYLSIIFKDAADKSCFSPGNTQQRLGD
jgi:hypothetical protein